MDSCTHTSPLIDIQPKKTRISMFKTTRISRTGEVEDLQKNYAKKHNCCFLASRGVIGVANISYFKSNF